VALLYDVSLSADKKGVPVLNPECVDRLLAILKKRGGAFAFCEINGESRIQPLLRVDFEPLMGNLEKRALTNKRNELSLSRYRNKIQKSLGKRQAKYSDILGAILKASVFFAEPHLAEGKGWTEMAKELSCTESAVRQVFYGNSNTCHGGIIRKLQKLFCDSENGFDST
jgi:hypothetical protein